MSQRWRVRGVPLDSINSVGGSVGEPFAAINPKGQGTIILTKENYFYEGDEERSSTLDENKQLERDRG